MPKKSYPIMLQERVAKNGKPYFAYVAKCGDMEIIVDFPSKEGMHKLYKFGIVEPVSFDKKNEN